jgi:hypothetical protein
MYRGSHAWLNTIYNLIFLFLFFVKKIEHDLQGRRPPGKTTQTEDDFGNWKLAKTAL